MASIDGHDPAIGAEVASVATRMIDHLAEVSNDMRDIIAQAYPELIVDERVKALLGASVQENVNTVLHVLQHEIAGTTAPNAALEFVRLLAQRDVGMTLIVQAYRLSQTRFQRDFITELLRGRTGDHVEGKVALSMVDTVSARSSSGRSSASMSRRATNGCHKAAPFARCACAGCCANPTSASPTPRRCSRRIASHSIISVP
jgi:hypothetical protein